MGDIVPEPPQSVPIPAPEAALPPGFVEAPPASQKSLRNARTETAPDPHAAERFHGPVSLANGTNLMPPRNFGGLGLLKISNYTGMDAAVKLKTSVGRTTVRFVYVRAMSDVTVSRIVPGEYVVQFATGRDWDADERAFRRDPTFAIFDKALSFSERQVDDGTVYSTHEITLHAVPNGNVRIRSISPGEFSNEMGSGQNRRSNRWPR